MPSNDINVIISFLPEPDVGVYLEPDTCFTFELNEAVATPTVVSNKFTVSPALGLVMLKKVLADTAEVKKLAVSKLSELVLEAIL